MRHIRPAIVLIVLMTILTGLIYPLGMTGLAGMLFPRQDRIFEVEVTTAARVAETIFDAREASVDRPTDIRAWLESQLYRPTYTGALQ